jgi:hypothetical protein
MYPDLVSGPCLPSLMESAGRYLINAASQGERRPHRLAAGTWTARSL